MSAHQVKLAKLASAVLADPTLHLEPVFEEIFQVAKQAEARRDALLTAVVVLNDVLPAYRLSEGAEKSSMRMKEAKGREAKTALIVKRLVKELKAADLSRGLVELYRCANPLVLQEAGDQLRDSLLSAVSKGNETAREGLVEALKNDVDLDETLSLVQKICCTKDPKKQKPLLVLLVAAKSEMSRFIVQASSSSLQGNDAELMAEFRKDLLVSSTEKDLQKIRKNEEKILTLLMSCYVKILRSHHLYREFLADVMAGLQKHALNVNIELMLEIVGELRKIFPSKNVNISLAIVNTIFVLTQNKNVLADTTVSMTRQLLASLVSSKFEEVKEEFGRFLPLVLKTEVVHNLQISENLVELLFSYLLDKTRSLEIDEVSLELLSTCLVNLFARGGEELKSLLDSDGPFLQRIVAAKNNPQYKAFFKKLSTFSEELRKSLENPPTKKVRC